MIKDTLNPDFVKPFDMVYYFEKSQLLKFEMFVNYIYLFIFDIHFNISFLINITMILLYCYISVIHA